MLGIVVIGEELDAVFGASADKIMRIISNSKLSADDVHAALEECFVGLWFNFLIPQGRTSGNAVPGNPLYVSHYIRPVSTIQRTVIQQVKRHQYLASSGPLIVENATNCPTKLSDECLSLPSSGHEESVMLSTWEPTQNTTQLEVEPYPFGEGFGDVKSGETNGVKIEMVSDKCINKSNTGSFNWKWRLGGCSYDSFSLDKGLSCLLSQTLDFTAETQEEKGDNLQNDVGVLFPDNSQRTVELDTCLKHEPVKRAVSDAGESQLSWLKDFDDPVFCQELFSSFHQDCSGIELKCSGIELKQPEDWRQGPQVCKSTLSRLTLNMQDRVLSGCTAASNFLPSGSLLEQSQTSGVRLWSKSDELDIEPSYQHEHLEVSTDSASVQVRGQSPLCFSTPVHVAKKLCARVTPMTVKGWASSPDCRSLLLFSDSEDGSRIESELEQNCGRVGEDMDRSHTPDLF
jgi:hypothetical protein